MQKETWGHVSNALARLRGRSEWAALDIVDPGASVALLGLVEAVLRLTGGATPAWWGEWSAGERRLVQCFFCGQYGYSMEADSVTHAKGCEAVGVESALIRIAELAPGPAGRLYFGTAAISVDEPPPVTIELREGDRIVLEGPDGWRVAACVREAKQVNSDGRVYVLTLGLEGMA